MRILDGLTVISLEQAISGPFCTRQLADLGARVIKIERPDGGDFARSYDRRVRGLASHFVWCNRSKESLTLDLKHAEGLDILFKLLEKTDILVQNLAPGAAARLGLSYEELRTIFPRLIVCDISGYGAGGPYGGKKAYDLLIQGESGFLSITGSDSQPAKAGNSIADIAAGMYAYSNILAALIARGKTSEGTWIDISMLECMIEWMSYPLYYAFQGADPPPRTDATHATIYPYGPFQVGDGSIILFGLQNKREWKSFCEKVLERPELVTDPRFASNPHRTAARKELRHIITDTLASLTGELVVKRLEAAQIANSHLNTMADVWSHPQLKARERWTQINTAVGPVPALLPPGAPGAFTAQMNDVPALGEHTDRILRELGYSEETIARFRSEGTI